MKKKVKKLYSKHALYAKNAKETETEKTKRFFVTFSSLVAFHWAGGGGPSLAMPMSLTGINIG